MSNAKDDFPDPDTPEITINLSLGIFNDIFLRLWSFAPIISIFSPMFLVFLLIPFRANFANLVNKIWIKAKLILYL